MSELQGLQSNIEAIRDLGGEVLAISTDSVEQNAKVTRRYGLSFLLLSDSDLAAIDAYGLRHPNGGLGGDISRPAVFIVDREGAIAWRHLPENWRVRVRPETLLQQLALLR